MPASARAAAEVPVAGYAYLGPESILTALGAALVEGLVALCAAAGVANRVAARPRRIEAANARGETREVIPQSKRRGNPCPVRPLVYDITIRARQTPQSDPLLMNDTTTAPEDFDGFLLDFIPLHDGVWSLTGIDDDRPVAMWSRPHAERYDQRLREATAREKAAEWALGDVTAKNLPACITKAETTLAIARAERALWAERVRVIYAAKGE